MISNVDKSNQSPPPHFQVLKVLVTCLPITVVNYVTFIFLKQKYVNTSVYVVDESFNEQNSYAICRNMILVIVNELV